MKKITTEEFIKKANKVHDNCYGYSKVNYVSACNKVIITCLIPDHGDFEQQPNNHLNGQGCPKCKSKKAAIRYRSNNEEFIKKANKVHDNRYDYSKVNYVNAYNKVIITCPNPEHGDFEQTPSSHLSGSGCPKCAVDEHINNCRNNVVEFMEKANKIHNYKYDYSKVNYINNSTKVIITCLNENHRDFEQIPSSHLNGCGCPKCKGGIRSIKEEFIKKANKVHNNQYDYSKVSYINSGTKVTITCPIQNHSDFEQTPESHLSGRGCPKCKSKKAAIRYRSNNEEFIKKANKVHDNYYDYSKVNYVNNSTKVIIICPIHNDFEQTPSSHLSGRGCSICNGRGWLSKHKLNLLNSITYNDLLLMDSFMLHVIISQGRTIPKEFNVLLDSDSNSDERIVKLNELKERYSNEIKDDNDDVINITNINNDDDDSLFMDNNINNNEISTIDEIDSEILLDVEDLNNNNDMLLPEIKSINNLHLIDGSLMASADDEAIESMIQYTLKELWNDILNEKISINTIKNENGGTYFNKIKSLFLEEYSEANNYKPKGNYSFKYEPNLMQKLIVCRLLKYKYYGNWSGTGAGKTLSFILSSREIDAKLTLIVALNSTIKQTSDAIKEIYPDSLVFTDLKKDKIYNRNKHNYLILNFEKFQQEYSEEAFQNLTNNNKIDFVVIDEVHNVKQRQGMDESIRREILNRLLARIRENNQDLYTLVMSATPVINDLFEAKSLLNLITGLDYSDLNTTRTLANVIKIHQQLLINGLRFIPKYDIKISELTGHNMSNLNIDGTHLIDDLVSLSQKDVVNIERLLLDDKLNAIQPYLKKGVIIYSHYVTGIFDIIKRFVKNNGFTVETYSGDESPTYRENIKENFINGKIDILIASDPITTGVDGLQYVCDRLILMTLPWTDSMYSQLKGRIYRQGSIFKNVEIIIPQVRIKMDGDNMWSWDVQRLNLIKNKRTLADAAVDGLMPSRVVPTEGTMLRKSIESIEIWKNRINSGEIITSNREVSEITLYPEINNEEERQRRILSELSEFNRRGKTTHSSTMNREFNNNPQSWFHYHNLRRERMEKWEEIPYEYIATKIKDRNDIIVDFGCGENRFKNCVKNNKVYSFDHIAIDDSVIACDMKDVSEYLSSESVNIAVFSLALWGTNHIDYLKEAYRILKYKGILYIAEPIRNYDTIESEQELINIITNIGFNMVGELEKRNKFIYLTAIKM